MKTKIIVLILSVFTLCSCRTHYVTVEKEVPIETVKLEYRTAIKTDSMYVHDSIMIYMLGDTVYRDKTKIVYRDILRIDTIHKTDSIEKPVYLTTETETHKLTSWQEFFFWSGAIAWIILIITTLYKSKTDKDQ